MTMAATGDAKSLHASMTVSVTVTNDCTSMGTASIRSDGVVTQSCDGRTVSSLTGSEFRGGTYGFGSSPIFARPRITLDALRDLRTIEF